MALEKEDSPCSQSFSQRVTFRPTPILLKRRLITGPIASYSGNTGFDGVCDFKLGQLTNNMAKEIQKKFIRKMGKKWQWAAEKYYMKILMTRWSLSFILLSCEGNQVSVSHRTCCSYESNLFFQTGGASKISDASPPQQVPATCSSGRKGQIPRPFQGFS